MVLITQISAPEVGLIYTTNNIQLKIGAKIIGKGTLYISQSALSWQPDSLPEGISIQWKQISVHGVSSNPSKCIYFMLDHKLVWRGVYEEATVRAGAAPPALAAANGNGAGGDAEAAMQLEEQAGARGDVAVQDGDEDEGNATDEDDEEEEEQITECWLMPDDPNTVDTMFQTMTDCQALHPDSADSISEESDFMDDDGDDDDDDELGRVGGGAEGDGAANGDADTAHGGMQNLNLNDDRFADADE